MAVACTVPLAALVTACGTSPATTSDDSERISVVVTTEIIADFVRQVGGDRVQVVSVVPPGGDPHSYEPTPSDARLVSHADMAFTNHLLLEEHALIKLFDSNVPAGAPNVSLAESAERYGAHLIPFVEDVGLDVVWLGVAVRGKATTRTAEVRVTATRLEGPGNMLVYVSDVFGVPEIHFDSRNGLDRSDTMSLPAGAHTHVNWAFTAPGMYALTLAAVLVDPGDAPRALGTGTFNFAVGVNPASIEVGKTISEGHADIAVDLALGGLFLCTAPRSCADQVGDVAPTAAVIEVPNRALALVPDDKRFAFLGAPSSEVWELPQAVLGKHVHGAIDPHTWEDVRNAKAYVQVIAETLAGKDPPNREYYARNSEEYLRELEVLDGYVAQQVATIPPKNRHLVSTHDAFSYLAEAYGLEVAGFVVPNPAQEPSPVQVRRLVGTIRNLAVPAVFAEPNLHARATVLRQVAKDEGVAVCKLYGDAFDKDVSSYIEMMRHNADELARCLGGRAQ